MVFVMRLFISPAFALMLKRPGLRPCFFFMRMVFFSYRPSSLCWYRPIVPCFAAKAMLVNLLSHKLRLLFMRSPIFFINISSFFDKPPIFNQQIHPNNWRSCRCTITLAGGASESTDAFENLSLSLSALATRVCIRDRYIPTLSWKNKWRW